MNTCTVRWSEPLLRQLSAEGNVYAPDEIIEVTGGLARDAKLVGAEYHPATELVELRYESANVEEGEEIVVAHRITRCGWPGSWYEAALTSLARLILSEAHRFSSRQTRKRPRRTTPCYKP